MNFWEENKSLLLTSYSKLSLRCLNKSSNWVLEFILISDPLISFPSLNMSINYSHARTCYLNKKYKECIFLLEDCDDQDSICLKYLSKFNNLKNNNSNFENKKMFLGLIQININYSIYDDLIEEMKRISNDFDDLNLFIFSFILVNAGKYMDAIKYLVKSLNGFPLNREAWELLKEVLIRFDDSVIAPVLEELPNHWTTVLFKIELYSELQQTEAALRLIPSLKLPRTPGIISIEATVYYHHRDYDTANGLYEELIQKDPYHIETIDYYSNLLFIKNDVSGLANLVKKLQCIDKFKPEALIAMGNFLAIHGKHDSAIKQFAIALELQPRFYILWSLIGHEFIEISNNSAAIASYMKAIEMNPRDFRALYGLGKSYEMSNMLYQANLYFRKSLTINPFDSRIWMELGDCYEKLGETENAIRCFQRAVCNVDNDGIAIFKLAKLYKKTNDIERAAFCFENFIEVFLGKDEIIKSYSEERSEEIKEAIVFLTHYFKDKNNFEKAIYYAEKLLYNESTVSEGNSIIKDIRKLTTQF